MSSLTNLFRRSQAISVAAKEEYQRAGHPEIDLEHLFLALLIVGGASSRVLGGLGVTLRDARAATERVHAEQIAALGVTLPDPQAEAVIPAPWIGDIQWSERALKVMRQDDPKRDDLVLLGVLLDEPSGHVARILRQLGIPDGAVQQAIADYVPEPPPAGSRPRSGWQEVTYTGHIPASPESVWSLVSDPARRLEWDGFFVASAELDDDGVLTTIARQTQPDGRPFKVKQQLLRTQHVVCGYEPGALIEWELTWPDLPGERFLRRMRIGIRPDGAGTHLTLTQSRLQLPGVRRRLFSPLYRYSTWQGLFARADAVSRVLR